jgi:hypothetical protein
VLMLVDLHAHYPMHLLLARENGETENRRFA